MAAASSVSRGMIVYYESQQQPPLTEVVVMAPLLATNADQMLGLVRAKKAAPMRA